MTIICKIYLYHLTTTRTLVNIQCILSHSSIFVCLPHTYREKFVVIKYISNSYFRSRHFLCSLVNTTHIVHSLCCVNQLLNWLSGKWVGILEQCSLGSRCQKLGSGDLHLTSWTCNHTTVISIADLECSWPFPSPEYIVTAEAGYGLKMWLFL